MIDVLIRLLLEQKVEANWEEIADAVWLAAALAARPGAPRDETAPAKGPRAEDRDRPAADGAGGAPPREAHPAPPSPSPSPSPPAPGRGPAPAGTLHAPGGPGWVTPGVAGAGMGGTPIRVPAAAALPGALEIGRGLRRLGWREPSPWARVLDEEATVRRIADDDLWVPVLRPAAARAFELALVVDAARSMVAWSETLREFRRLLEHLGAFRDVRGWRLHAAPGPDGPLTIAPDSDADASRRHAGELRDPAGRRVILVASDCVSAPWRDGRARALLEGWGRTQPVAVVQVLPASLWRQTGLDGAAPVSVRCPRVGAPNAQLRREPGARRPAPPGLRPGAGGRDDGSRVLVPVLRLEPEVLGGWARLLTNSGEATWPAYLLGLSPPPPPARGDPPTAEERVRRFARLASPAAQDLAACLAAAPLRLPIVRLVQRAVLPGSGPLHLAEFLLGGLVRVGPSAAAGPAGPDFEFHDRVRDRLLDRLPFPRAVEVFDLVSRHIAEHFGQALDFQALLAVPGGRAPLDLLARDRPFAEVAATLLRRLGGRYLEAADRIEGRAPAGPTPTAPRPAATPSRAPQPGPPFEPGAAPAGRTVYVLAVGIDAYPPPVPRLQSCVNDIREFADYLHARVDSEGGRTLSLLVLLDEGATRAAVIAGFREHLRRARAGDVALFYFSGHGSRRPSPPEFWHLEPDRLDETLVCFDSRSPGGWDLADKELAKLIDEVAAGGAHVVVILDCSHSGSGTSRDVDAPSTAARQLPTDLRPRPLETFLVGPDEANQLSGAHARTETTSGWPSGRHVLLAACRDDEEAHEYIAAGIRRGAFSYFLGETLRKATEPLTYRDLFARTAARLRAEIPWQSPQLEASRPSDLDGLFLDGALRPSAPYYVVRPSEGRWILQAGAVHGLPRAGEQETIELALYPFDARPEDLHDRSRAIGRARTLEVLATTSRVELSGIADPSGAGPFKAVIVGRPRPALLVSVEGDFEGVEPAVAALAHAGPNGAASPYVRRARAGEPPRFRLFARRGQYLIMRPDDDRPLVGAIDGYSEADALTVVRQLDHIARWTLAAELNNPESSIRPGDVEMAILQGDEELAAPEIRLEYRYEDGEWVPPQFRVRLTNRSDRRLFVALLELTESYAISAGLQDSGSIRLDPGQAAWAQRGRPIAATVPEELWRQGVVESRNILKLIVSTQEFDARVLEQPGLDPPGRRPTR